MYCQRISFVCFAAMGVVLVLASAAPAQLPQLPGLQLLLQADAGITLDGDKVTNWSDQSSQGNHFTGQVGNEPRFDATGGLVGQPVVTFGLDDDGEDWLTADEFFDFASWTIFAVAQGRTEVIDNAAEIFADYGADFNDRVGLGLGRGSGHPSNPDGWNVHARSSQGGGGQVNVTAAGGDNDEQVVILTGRLDSATGTASLWSKSGGLLQTTTDATYVATDVSAAGIPPTVGTNSGFFDGGIRGYIAELIIYDSALNDTDRVAVEDYLHGKHTFGVGQPAITDFTWTQDGLGDWASNTNWMPGTRPPDGPNHKAIFADTANITGPTNVSTAAPVTVNRIEFSNTTHSFLIGGFGSVNMSATTTPIPEDPSMSVQGTHQFQAAVNLLNDTTVDVASDSTLTFNETLNLMNQTLTKTGAGTMAVRNDLVSGGGTVQIGQGTVSGNGTIGGDVNNDGGTVSPGNSPGVLSINGNYSQGDGPGQVPEPTALILLALGIAGIAAASRGRLENADKFWSMEK